jgi:hypothetical protein
MITKSDLGTWCDYCKKHWGRVKGGAWHPQASTQAAWTVHSKSPKSNATKRHYCEKCLLEVTRFEATHSLPGYFWALKDQVEAVAPIQLEMDGKLNG